MPDDKQARKELKVTDKRIFTPEGEIREEFQKDVQPAAADASKAPARPEAPPEPAAGPKPEPKAEARPEPRPQEPRSQESSQPAGERRHTPAAKGENPDTPFTNFIESYIAQAYMLLGLLRNPYQPQPKLDPAGARQIIEILSLLKEKTKGNLDPDEADFLETHLGELKLAFVQRTKTI